MYSQQGSILGNPVEDIYGFLAGLVVLDVIQRFTCLRAGKKSDQNKKGYRRFCQVTLIYVDETALQSKADASQVVAAGELLPPSGDVGN